MMIYNYIFLFSLLYLLVIYENNLRCACLQTIHCWSVSPFFLDTLIFILSLFSIELFLLVKDYKTSEGIVSWCLNMIFISFSPVSGRVPLIKVETFGSSIAGDFPSLASIYVYLSFSFKPFSNLLFGVIHFRLSLCEVFLVTILYQKIWY